MEPKLCLTFAGLGFRAPLSHPQPGTESPPRWTRELKQNPSLTCMSLSLNLTKPLIFRSFSDPKSQGREKNLHQNMVLILLLSDGIRSNYTQLPESPTIYSLNSPDSNKLNAPKFVFFAVYSVPLGLLGLVCGTARSRLEVWWSAATSIPCASNGLRSTLCRR